MTVTNRFKGSDVIQQGEIRKPFEVNNAKKEGKRIEQERLEISSIKLEISREHFMQRWAQ